jgi:probable rRNA maturation factor
MTIEIANESGVTIDETALADVVGHVLAEMNVHPLAELSVLLVDEEYMTSLHIRWMDEAGPTDVLAFPMDELDTARGPDEEDEPAPALLGDVVLCPEVARRQAAQAKHSLDDELHLLATHGVLHLLGYDHAEPDDERRMFALQNRLLQAWRADSTQPSVDSGRDRLG